MTYNLKELSEHHGRHFNFPHFIAMIPYILSGMCLGTKLSENDMNTNNFLLLVFNYHKIEVLNHLKLVVLKHLSEPSQI